MKLHLSTPNIFAPHSYGHKNHVVFDMTGWEGQIFRTPFLKANRQNILKKHESEFSGEFELDWVLRFTVQKEFKELKQKASGWAISKIDWGVTGYKPTEDLPKNPGISQGFFWVIIYNLGVAL